MQPIQNVTVIGTGVLGSQIAYQAAFHGFAVTAYDVSDDALEHARTRIAQLAPVYVSDKVAGATAESTEAAANGIRYSSDMAEAVADADLVIEAAPESIDIKRNLYQQLAEAAPQLDLDAVFDYDAYLTHLPEIFERLEALRS